MPLWAWLISAYLAIALGRGAASIYFMTHRLSEPLDAEDYFTAGMIGLLWPLMLIYDLGRR